MTSTILNSSNHNTENEQGLIELTRYFTDNEKKLTQDQRIIYEKIMDSNQKDIGKVYFYVHLEVLVRLF